MQLCDALAQLTLSFYVSAGALNALVSEARIELAPAAFDNTVEACLRSFRVMALAAPFYAAYVAINYASIEVEAETA